jgi:6,7-dimethyl-8-ribityllumazine synthase
MIRSIHRLYVPTREKDFSALVEIFDSLGLTRGEAWKGHRSQGIKLEALSAGVEIGHGDGFPQADLVIECDSADAVYDMLRRRKVKIAEDIASLDWGARLFVIELPARAGRVAIFSYNHDWPDRDQALAGNLNAQGMRFGVVVARWNAFITERMLQGALDALHRCGARREDIILARVPGSFEIPIAARKLALTGEVDAVITIGCLIRGETAHYEQIATEVTRGIGQSAQETGIPHTYGVITTENLEQAIDRAGLKSGNKGFEAAMSAIEMVSLARHTASLRAAKSHPIPRTRRKPAVNQRKGK